MSEKRWKTADETPGNISLPYGIRTQHTWHEMGEILRIVNDLDIKTFIELGTYNGGLFSLLIGRVVADKDWRVYSLEIDRTVVDPSLAGLSNLLIRDVMAEKTIEEVKALISYWRGKALIYCDNGNKVAEMGLYAKILRKGDVIMCHDYSEGQDVVGIDKYGFEGARCGPEVHPEDLLFLKEPEFRKFVLPGTRIVGGEKL